MDVEDARQPVGGLIVHSGEVVEGRPPLDACIATVDGERRLDIMRNHTATHLLHAQLRAVLGAHVQQRGSLVAPDRLRFDFSHDAPLTPEELDLIQRNINAAILANMPVSAEWKDREAAKSEGAMALFGEKYGDDVRTVNIWAHDGERVSYELCGGTHVDRTGIIGPFVFTAEGSVAQGIRRVEALTGRGAEAYIRRSLRHLDEAAARLGTTPDTVSTRLAALQDELREQQHENVACAAASPGWSSRGCWKARDVNGVSCWSCVSPTAPDTLREMTDWFRDRSSPASSCWAWSPRAASRSSSPPSAKT